MSDINNIKDLITNKLAIIDICNADDGINSTNSFRVTKFDHELNGIKQALRLMGFDLQFDKNPYYYDNKNPSTFTIELLQY